MIGVLFNQLDMENIVIVNEVLEALNTWEWMNKYFDGKYQIITLNEYNSEIYIAHNLFTEMMLVNGYDFMQNIIEILTEYCDTDENKQYMNEFWEPKLKEILKIQKRL